MRPNISHSCCYACKFHSCRLRRCGRLLLTFNLTLTDLFASAHGISPHLDCHYYFQIACHSNISSFVFCLWFNVHSVYQTYLLTRKFKAPPTACYCVVLCWLDRFYLCRFNSLEKGANAQMANLFFSHCAAACPQLATLSPKLTKWFAFPKTRRGSVTIGRRGGSRSNRANDLNIHFLIKLTFRPFKIGGCGPFFVPHELPAIRLMTTGPAPTVARHLIFKFFRI